MVCESSCFLTVNVLLRQGGQVSLRYILQELYAICLVLQYKTLRYTHEAATNMENNLFLTLEITIHKPV